MNLVVNVGFGDLSQPDFDVHVHFSNDRGDEWTINPSWSSLKVIDSHISNLTSVVSHIPFPNLDNKYLLPLFLGCFGKSSKHHQQIVEFVRLRFENWLHGIIMRLHFMPFEALKDVERLLGLPCGPKSNNALEMILQVEGPKEQSMSDSIAKFYKSMTNSESFDARGIGNQQLKILAVQDSSMDISIQRPYELHVNKNLVLLSRKQVRDQIMAEQLHEQSEYNLHPLIRVHVNRCQVSVKGFTEYEVKILYNSSSSDCISVQRRYREFRALSKRLLACGVVTLDTLDMALSQADSSNSGSNNNNNNNSQQVNRAHYRTGEGGAVVHRRRSSTSSVTSLSTTSTTTSSSPKSLTALVIIMAHFSQPPMRCYAGVTLSESALSRRARHLDCWVRELCVQYKLMNDSARQAMRAFLGIHASESVGISVQDRLATGCVEASKPNISSYAEILSSSISSGGTGEGNTTPPRSIAPVPVISMQRASSAASSLTKQSVAKSVLSSSPNTNNALFLHTNSVLSGGRRRVESDCSSVVTTNNPHNSNGKPKPSKVILIGMDYISSDDGSCDSDCSEDAPPGRASVMSSSPTRKSSTSSSSLLPSSANKSSNIVTRQVNVNAITVPSVQFLQGDSPVPGLANNQSSINNNHNSAPSSASDLRECSVLRYHVVNTRPECQPSPYVFP